MSEKSKLFVICPGPWPGNVIGIKFSVEECYIYVHQRLSEPILCNDPSWPSERSKGIFEGFEYTEYSKKFIEWWDWRDSSQIWTKLPILKTSQYPILRGIGGGANAGRFRTTSTPQTRDGLRPPPQTSLFTRPWISRPTNPAYSMFGCAGKDSCGEAGKQRISICRRWSPHAQ